MSDRVWGVIGGLVGFLVVLVAVVLGSSLATLTHK
jgi:hypothetical protein